MATEREIREAERAKLEGLVREHGTASEQGALLVSGIMRSGISLTRLAEAAESGQSAGRYPPEPEFLAKLTRRIERRMRLKLPKAKCAADPPRRYCDCLELALDQPGADGKRATLKLAAAFHKRTRAEPISPPAAPDPQESPVSTEEPTYRVEDNYLPLAPPKAEPRVRVIRRTPKWYDDKPSFSDMTF